MLLYISFVFSSNSCDEKKYVFFQGNTDLGFYLKVTCISQHHPLTSTINKSQIYNTLDDFFHAQRPSISSMKTINNLYVHLQKLPAFIYQKSNTTKM